MKPQSQTLKTAATVAKISTAAITLECLGAGMLAGSGYFSPWVAPLAIWLTAIASIWVIATLVAVATIKGNFVSITCLREREVVTIRGQWLSTASSAPRYEIERQNGDVILCEDADQGLVVGHVYRWNGNCLISIINLDGKKNKVAS